MRAIRVAEVKAWVQPVPLAWVQGEPLILVLSHPAAVPSSGSSALSPHPPEAVPARSGLELSRCRGQGPCTKPLPHGPQALSLSSPFPLQATSGPTRSLSWRQFGSSPASSDLLLAGRQGLHLTLSKPVSLIAINNKQEGPPLAGCQELSQPLCLNSHINPSRQRFITVVFYRGEK